MKLKRSHKIVLLLISLVLFFVWVDYEQRFVVKGRVVDASTGKPVEGASVAISWSGTHLLEAFIPYASGSYTIENAKATTDKDGYFEIPKYFLKSFYMGVYKKDYICWSSNKIFMSGLDIKEKKYRVKKRLWFWVKNGMTIELVPFTKEYPRFEHAGFISAVSSAARGLEGTEEEMKYYNDIYWNRKNEK